MMNSSENTFWSHTRSFMKVATNLVCSMCLFWKYRIIDCKRCLMPIFPSCYTKLINAFS